MQRWAPARAPASASAPAPLQESLSAPAPAVKLVLALKLALVTALALALGASCGEVENQARAASAAAAPPGTAVQAGTAAPAAPRAPALARPRRIVSIAPNLTETLFALGLGERVVGVDDFSVWPPEVAAKARIGGLFNPNLEKIVALRPDLAVLLPSERDVAAKLRRLGIDCLIVPAESLADVERSFHLVAGRCGVAQAGDRLAAAWRAGVAPRPVPGSPRVMLSVDRQPGHLTGILAAAHGTFLDELLARLGGVNVFADAASRYPQVELEEVVARAPQVILELRSAPAPPALAAALVGDWRRSPTLPAFRAARIAVIAGDYVTVPGPRLPRLYQRMREALLAGTGSPSGGARR